MKLKSKDCPIFNTKRLLIRYQVAAGTRMWFNYALSTLIKRHGKEGLRTLYCIGNLMTEDQASKRWNKRR